MTLDAWHDFFVAAAGAAAALAGLVVVSVSVNIASILKYPQLPARAAAAVGAFVSILLVTLVCLTPQPPLALGIEVGVIGVLGWLLQVYASRAAARARAENGRPPSELVFLIVRGQLQALPFVAAGVLLAVAWPGAPLLVLAGAALIFVLSMLEAWVLLVEILR